MAYENFDYQGFLRDLGYPEEEIPQEFTEEQKEQVFAMAAHSTLKSYQEREEAMFPMLDKKQARHQALDRLLQDVPMFREPLGIPEEITDRDEPYRLENFEAFIKATYPGQTNLDEPAENYINSYTDFIYNDNVRYKRPFLRDVNKRDFAKHFRAANNIDKEITVDDVFKTVDASRTPRQITPHYAAGELKKLEGWKGSFQKLKDDLIPFSGTSQWRKSWNDLFALLGDVTGSDYLREKGLYGRSAYAERERRQNYVPHYTKSLSEAYREIVSEAAMNAALDDPDANRGTFGNLGTFGRLKMIGRMFSELAPQVGELAVSNAAPTIGILATDVLTKAAIALAASGGAGTGAGAAAGALTGIRKAAQFLNKSRALSSIPGMGASALFMLPEAVEEARELGLYREQDALKGLIAGGVITGLEYFGAMASIGFATWGNRIASEGAQTFWRNFMGEFPDLAKMTFAKNAWKQNAKLLAGTVGNIVGDASAEGLAEGLQRAVSMAFSESIGGHYSWGDYLEEGLSDYFVGLAMSAPISGVGTVGRGFARAADFKKREKEKAEARAWLEEQRENLRGFSKRSVLSHLAHARFTNAAGEEVTVVSGAGVTGRGTGTREAVENLVRNANARRGNNVAVDSSTIISDPQNPNRASIQYGNGVVTYNSVDGDAVTKLAGLVAEHNDGTNSLFTFSEGMAITEVRNPANPSQIEYEVKFDAEPEARGVFANLYHPAVLDRDFGNFASNTHLITNDAVRNNPLVIGVQDATGTLNFMLVEQSDFDRQDAEYSILGKEPGELVLFDESRGIVFTLRDVGNDNVELTAKTVYGRSLEVPENLRRQDKKTGITVDALYGIGAKPFTDATGKQRWRFNLDEMERQFALDGLTLDRANSTSDHVEATTPSGKSLLIDVDATNGNIFPFYQGQLLFNPNLNARAFEISDVGGFPAGSLEPHRANFGSWSRDVRSNSRTDAASGVTGFLKSFEREDGFTLQYDIALDSKGNLRGLGRFGFDYRLPNVTWSNVKAFLQKFLGTSGRTYRSRIEEGYIIATNEGTPRYFNSIDYDETTRTAYWGNWIEDLNRVLNVYPLGSEAELVAKIEELSNPNVTVDYVGDGVQISAQRFVRFLSSDGKSVVVKKLPASDENLPISFLGITPKDVVGALSPNEIDAIRRIATNSYQMASLSPVEQEVIGALFDEIEAPARQTAQARTQAQTQAPTGGTAQPNLSSPSFTIFDDSDVYYESLDQEEETQGFGEPLQAKADTPEVFKEAEAALEEIRKDFDALYNDLSLTPEDLLKAQHELMVRFDTDVVKKTINFIGDEVELWNAFPTPLRYRLLNFMMMAKIQRALTRLGKENFPTYSLETKNVIIETTTKPGELFPTGGQIFVYRNGSFQPLAELEGGGVNNLRRVFQDNLELFENEEAVNAISNRNSEEWKQFRAKVNSQQGRNVHLEMVYRILKDGELYKTFIVDEPTIRSTKANPKTIRDYYEQGSPIIKEIEEWFWGKNGEISGEIQRRLDEQTSNWKEEGVNRAAFKHIYPWMGNVVDLDKTKPSEISKKVLKGVVIHKKGQRIMDMPIEQKYAGDGVMPIYTNEKYFRERQDYIDGLERPSSPPKTPKEQEIQNFNGISEVIEFLLGKTVLFTLDDFQKHEDGRLTYTFAITPNDFTVSGDSPLLDLYQTILDGLFHWNNKHKIDSKAKSDLHKTPGFETIYFRDGSYAVVQTPKETSQSVLESLRKIRDFINHSEERKKPEETEALRREKENFAGISEELKFFSGEDVNFALREVREGDKVSYTFIPSNEYYSRDLPHLCSQIVNTLFRENNPHGVDPNRQDDLVKVFGLYNIHFQDGSRAIVDWPGNTSQSVLKTLREIRRLIEHPEEREQPEPKKPEPEKPEPEKPETPPETPKTPPPAPPAPPVETPEEVRKNFAEITKEIKLLHGINVPFTLDNFQKQKGGKLSYTFSANYSGFPKHGTEKSFYYLLMEIVSRLFENPDKHGLNPDRFPDIAPDGPFALYFKDETYATIQYPNDTSRSVLETLRRIRHLINHPEDRTQQPLGEKFFNRLIDFGFRGREEREDYEGNPGLIEDLRERMRGFLDGISQEDLELLEEYFDVSEGRRKTTLDIVLTFARYSNGQLDHFLGKESKHLKGEVNQEDILTESIDISPSDLGELSKQGYLPQLTFIVTSPSGRKSIFRVPRHFLNYLHVRKAADNFNDIEQRRTELNLNNQKINVYLSYNVRPVSKRGYGNYFSQSTDSMSPASFRTLPLESELKDAYGDDQIDAWLDSGHLVIVPTQEAAIAMIGESAELIYSADGYIQGFYDGSTNRIVFVEDGIADGEAHKVMVHERGLHANRLGLRNAEDFQAVLRYIEEHRGDGTPEGQAIRDAYSELPDFIPEQNRTEEALGKILDAMSDAVYNIVQRVINAIKRFLHRHGWIDVESFTLDDFVMMARVASRANVKDSMLRNGTYYPYVGGEPLSEEYQANIEEEIGYFSARYRRSDNRRELRNAVNELGEAALREEEPFQPENEEREDVYYGVDQNGYDIEYFDVPTESTIPEILRENFEVRFVRDLDEAALVQRQYEQAMSRQSDYIGNLYSHLLRRRGLLCEDNGSYLAGFSSNDTFVISHFAPKNMKSGATMLKNIANGYMKVLAAVPSYQGSMLKRVGFREVGKIPQYFNGELVLKTVYANNAVNEEDLDSAYSNLANGRSRQEIEELVKIARVVTGKRDGEDVITSGTQSLQSLEPANIEEEAVQEFGPDVLDAINIVNTQNEAETIIARLREQGGSVLTSTSDQIAAKYPNWMDNQIVEEGAQGQRTQIKGTVATYKKLVGWIKEMVGESAKVLDASSGLGYGTLEMREQGLNVDDVEPYPGSQRMETHPPTFTSYQAALDSGNKYDVIVSNAVLNVIPDDWRDGVVEDMGKLLAPGGKLFVNVRKVGEEKTIKSKIPLDSPTEFLIGTPENITSYQKFFTVQELKDYILGKLGEGHTAETSKLGGASIIVTRDSSATVATTAKKTTAKKKKTTAKKTTAKPKVVHRADPDAIYSVSPKGTKTKIKRSKYGVGKAMGKKIYFHAAYASMVVPADLLANALEVAKREGFQYKTMMYDEGTKVVRFDESLDFDFAREPCPGRMLNVHPDGTITRSKTDQIFHHKWLWVTPDYTGFNVAESQAWSAAWLKANEGKSAPSGYMKQWNAKLRDIGLGEHVEEGGDDVQIKFSREGLIQGFYYDGQVYLVRDGIAKGHTVPVLMHEIGDHAADLGFLEDDEYNAILDSLRRRRDKDPDVQRAVRRALENGEQEDSPSFWREVSAYMIEEHGKSTSGILARILNFFKKVLFRLGILNADRFSTNDLALFAYSATKAWIGKNAAGRTSRDILLSRGNSRSGMTDADVDGLDNATAKSKMYYEAVKQNFNDIFTQARRNRLSNLQSEISSLAASVPEFEGGGISGFMDALLRSNIDVLSNPAVQRAIIDAKLFLDDIAANVIQSTPDKVAKDPDVALEHLRAIAEAVDGKEFTRLEEDARDEREVLSMRTNRNILEAVQVPQAQSYFDYVMNETRRVVAAANDLFQYTPIENPDGSLTPALSNASGQVVARFDGLNVYDAPLAMQHILLKTRVGEGRKPSDVEQPDPFFYEKLRSRADLPSDFGKTVSLLDDDFTAGIIDSLPQHIKARIHVHKNRNDPMTKRLLVDTNSYGVFVPLVPDPTLRGKTIHVRAFDISPEEFVKTVSEEVGHFSWQMLATPEMAFVMDDIFELFKDAIVAELDPYLTADERRYKEFGRRGDNVYRKTILLNELFSKNAINVMDKRYDGTAFRQYGITQEKLREIREKITSEVRDKIALKMNTAIFSSFFDREGQPTAEEATERDFTEFFTDYFTALMSPAAGKSIIYSLPNLAGGETQIRLNDWGQIRRTIPPSREAQIRAEIKEMHDMQDSDLMKRLVIWRYENLPLNLHLNWLRNLLPKKYGWISMPYGRLGDTIIGSDVSVMLARAFQALNDDSGLLRRRQFTETIQFANYVRANNLDPDLIDKSKGYVKFMEENELKNEKMLKLAEEFDKMLAQGREQINNNVLRIQDEFQKTIEALEVWAQRMGLDWKTLNDMKKEVVDMSNRFRNEYTHRTYRAFTPEDHDNLVEMRNYLLEDDPDRFLSARKGVAEREIAKLQDDYANGRIATKRELRKRIEPHQHILDIYKRMRGLRTYVEGIITGVYENWKEDPDAASFVTSYHESSIHGRMLHVINGILNRNMNTEREKRKSNAEIEHSKFALISGVLGSGRLDRNNYYESAYMDFLGEVTNPVENLMLSLDQQEKVISKIAFNRMLGEKILAYGMGRFKTGIEGEMLPGIKKISKNETGTFLSFIKLDEFFDREFEREYDVIAASTNTLDSPYINFYKAVRANLTIYNPKLMSSNYASNVSLLAVSGHLFNIANVFKGAPIVAESWMRQIMGKSRNDSEFVNQILKEMQEHQVFGGSSSNTEMRTYSHNVNERFLFFLVGSLKKAHLLSRQGEFKWKTWIENVCETAREIYGYGDEWGKIIAYMNNRAVQTAKFESELDPTDPNFDENVRQAGAKEAADITKLETTTWELTPMEIRRLSGANFRLLTGDFIMHNFQIMRITAALVGRFLEAMKEWRRLAALPVKTEAQEKYQSLVGREAARRGVGLALGTSFAYLIMKGATYPMSFLISALLGIFRGTGDDDKEFEEGEIRGLTAGEREGFQMMLNSTMSGDNMWAPFAKTGKHTFLATNDPRQHAALSLMSPPVPSENPSLWERIRRQQQQIINIAGDNILGETYNALRGKDRYGQDVGYWKTGWNSFFRFLLPEAASQLVFAGDALWSWSTGGDLKGRTVNDMAMGYERKQTLGQMAFSLLGAGVREYDVRDLVTSMGYQMKQHTTNNTNHRRRDFIQKVIRNPGASDAVIASDVADMMDYNQSLMDKSMYNVRAARTAGLDDKKIVEYFSRGRNAPDTTVMSLADSEKLTRSENIYDHHIITALERQRNLFAEKLGQDSKYTKEQREEIARTIDRYLERYKAAMGEGKYLPQNSKSSRRSENARPTGKTRYNRLSVGDGRTRIINVKDGDTFDVIGPRGEQFVVRLADVDAFESGQGAVGWDARSRISALVNGASNIEVIPRYTDKYRRVVAEVYADGVNLSTELLKGGHGVLYDKYARNRDVLDMIRRGEARVNSSAMNPQEYRRQQ